MSNYLEKQRPRKDAAHLIKKTRLLEVLEKYGFKIGDKVNITDKNHNINGTYIIAEVDDGMDLAKEVQSIDMMELAATLPDEERAQVYLKLISKPPDAGQYTKEFLWLSVKELADLTSITI